MLPRFRFGVGQLAKATVQTEAVTSTREGNPSTPRSASTPHDVRSQLQSLKNARRQPVAPHLSRMPVELLQEELAPRLPNTGLTTLLSANRQMEGALKGSAAERRLTLQAGLAADLDRANALLNEIWTAVPPRLRSRPLTTLCHRLNHFPLADQDEALERFADAVDALPPATSQRRPPLAALCEQARGWPPERREAAAARLLKFGDLGAVVVIAESIRHCVTLEEARGLLTHLAILPESLQTELVQGWSQRIQHLPDDEKLQAFQLSVQHALSREDPRVRNAMLESACGQVEHLAPPARPGQYRRMLALAPTAGSMAALAGAIAHLAPEGQKKAFDDTLAAVVERLPPSEWMAPMAALVPRASDLPPTERQAAFLGLVRSADTQAMPAEHRERVVSLLADPFVRLSGEGAAAARERYSEAVARFSASERHPLLQHIADIADELPASDDKMATLAHLLSMDPPASALATLALGLHKVDAERQYAHGWTLIQATAQKPPAERKAPLLALLQRCQVLPVPDQQRILHGILVQAEQDTLSLADRVELIKETAAKLLALPRQDAMIGLPDLSRTLRRLPDPERTAILDGFARKTGDRVGSEIERPIMLRRLLQLDLPLSTLTTLVARIGVQPHQKRMELSELALGAIGRLDPAQWAEPLAKMIGQLPKLIAGDPHASFASREQPRLLPYPLFERLLQMAGTAEVPTAQQNTLLELLATPLSLLPTSEQMKGLNAFDRALRALPSAQQAEQVENLTMQLGNFTPANTRPAFDFLLERAVGLDGAAELLGQLLKKLPVIEPADQRPGALAQLRAAKDRLPSDHQAILGPKIDAAEAALTRTRSRR